MSLEDIIERGFMEEKEPLIVHSRKVLKQLCEEYGITNERRVSSEYSAFVSFMKREDEESARKMLTQWQEDKAVTKIPV